jgi:DNA polymerase III sliding clamp (beta) subunit (PCNA family)
MKIEFLPDDLILPLQSVCGMAQGPHMGTASKNLLRIQGTPSGRLQLSAGCETRGISWTVPGSAEEPGQAVVIASLFLSFLRSLPKKMPVHAFTVEKGLELNCGLAIQSKLQTVTAEDFLSSLTAEDHVAFKKIAEMSSEDLKNILSATLFAASRSEERFVLTGTRWKLLPGLLQVTATNGERLADARLEIVSFAEEELPPLLIPASFLMEVERSPLLSSSKVEIHLGPTHLKFQTPQGRLYTALMTGNFPSLDHIIEGTGVCEGSFEASPSGAAEGLKCLRSVTDSMGEQVTISMENSDALLKAQSDRDSAAFHLPVSAASGSASAQLMLRTFLEMAEHLPADKGLFQVMRFGNLRIFKLSPSAQKAIKVNLYATCQAVRPTDLDSKS